MSKKVLIIDAGGLSVMRHDGLVKESGLLNDTFVNETIEFLKKHHDEYKVTKIRDGYKVDEEVAKYQWADVILYQSPMWWMGLPWQLKKYIDEVFCPKIFYKDDGRSRDDPEHNYGTGGLMQDKWYSLSMTTNAPAGAFVLEHEFFEHDPKGDKILFPFYKLHDFVGMKKLPTFWAHDVVKNPDLGSFVENYHVHLNELWHLINLKKETEE